MKETRTTHFVDFSGGIKNASTNPYTADPKSLVDGLNVVLSEGGIKTRPGSSLSYDGATLPNQEIRALKQVRFPTSELTYLVAQSSAETAIAWDSTATLERSGHSLIYDQENGVYILFGGEDTSGYNNDTWSYDPDTDTWSELTTSGTLPDPRKDHTAVYNPADGCMYVFGGRAETAPLTFAYVNDCHKLNLDTRTWSEVTLSGDVPTTRSQHIAVLISSTVMMVCGGYNGSSDRPVNYYYDINLSTGVCTETIGTLSPEGPPYLSGRRLHAAAHNGGSYVYIMGGVVNSEYCENDLWRLDRTAGTWTRLASCGERTPEDAPVAGFDAHTMHYCNGYLIAIGGENWGIEVLAYNEAYQVYDIADNEWIAVLPDGDLGARAFHASAISDTGDILVHGGSGESAQFLSSGYIAIALCSADGASSAFSVGYGLYASSTNLPSAAVTFEQIYSMSANAGVCSIETFGDRAIITEGVEHVPLVFSPGDLTADTYTSWSYPTRVLANRNGSDNFDISQYVLDSDSDNAADIGGMSSWGELLICCDRPEVSKFYLEFDTPSTGGDDSTNQFSVQTLFNSNDTLVREDIKGSISRWFQDSGVTGHFEGASITLDGVVADNSGNLAGTVSIPTATAHPYVEGDVIEIRDTTNYSGTKVLPAQTGGDDTHIIITAAYVPETCASPDTARLRPTLGSGNDIPLITPGVSVVFAGDTAISIVAITSAGEQDGEVELSEAKATTNVADVYGLSVYDAAIHCSSQGGNTGTLTDTYSYSFSADSVFPCAQKLTPTSIRMVIPATGGGSGTHIRLTFQASNTAITHSLAPGLDLNSGLAPIRVSIVEQDAGANGTGTPTEILFSGVPKANSRPGNHGFIISKGQTITSDLIPFTYDDTKSHIVILDFDPLTTYFKTRAYWTSGMPVILYYNNSCCSWDSEDDSSGYLLYRYTEGNTSTEATPTAMIFTSGVQYRGPCAVNKIEVVSSLVSAQNMHVAYTSDDGYIDLSYVDDIIGVMIYDTTPGSSLAHYAISFDPDRYYWWMWKTGLSAWRNIVYRSGGTYWYVDGSDVAHDTGVALLMPALRAAMAITENQMTSTECNAIPDASWGTPDINSRLNLAVALTADGTDTPSVSRFEATVSDTGQNVIEGWNGEDWTEGDGWTDGTALFTQDGEISYDGGVFTSQHQTISGIPGYWFRIRSRGTSDTTTLTRVRYKGQTQALANIGDGVFVQPSAFVHYNGTTHATADWTSDVGDNTYSEFSVAPLVMTTDDELFVGYLTPFNEIWIVPYANNNQNISALIPTYWNGTEYATLTVVDGTSDFGSTLAKAGRITFAVPSDWQENVPQSTGFERGYHIRLMVSANLSDNTSIAECRVAPVPEVLKKHRFVSQFQNRLVLAGRPDAYAQADISAPLMEYAFTGQSAAAYNLGGDAINCMINAWGTLMIGKVDKWFQVRSVTGNFDQDILEVEASRHIPINNTVIVKAPLGGYDDGARSGLFFINRYGAWAVTGLQSDYNFGTARHAWLSEHVNWWTGTTYPYLDLDYLHLACGEYWPEENWIVWAVPMVVSGSSQTTNNRLLVYDLSLGTFLPPMDIAASALCTAHHYNVNAPGKRGSLGLYAGNYSGQIVRLFGHGVTQDAGANITASATTPWLHFGEEGGGPEWEKRLRYVRLHGYTNGTTITFTVYADGGTTASKTQTYTALDGLSGQDFSVEVNPENLIGRFFKFKIDVVGYTDIHGFSVDWVPERKYYGDGV